jgi:hypothetical protein
MMWMPAPDEETCRLVSGAVYRLTRNAGSSDTTQYAFGWRSDAHGAWWMDMDPDIVLPVHPERSTETANTLAMFVAAGQLSQASADAIVALVQTRVGQTVTLGEVIPPEWAAQMVAEPPTTPEVTELEPGDGAPTLE